MTEPKPQVLTRNRKLRLTRAHRESLGQRLAHAYSGRENHAALFRLTAERDPASGDTLLVWTDDFTGQLGSLGSLRPRETKPVVRALFEQLRSWRARCENGGVAKTAVAGGAR